MPDAGIRNKGWSQNHAFADAGGARARRLSCSGSDSIINPSPIVADDTMASSEIDKLDDLQKAILFIIGSADAAVDELHLQKMAFQALKATEFDPREFGFRPGPYGPCSTRVSECVESLRDMGFLVIEGEKASIIPEASDEIASLDLPEAARFRIEMIVGFISGLDEEELILMTCTDGTESADGHYLKDSEVKDVILKDRVNIAIRMYGSRKATLERASELAGMDLRNFEDLVLEKGIMRYD